MIINIVSILRQNSSYIASFICQLQNLSKNNYEVGTITLVCENPKETENCRIQALIHHDPKFRIVYENNDDRDIFSLEEKVAQWASIINQGIESALTTESTHIFFIESDLCFPHDILDVLINKNVDIIAPLVLIGGHFYDSWGFRTLSNEKMRAIGDIKTNPLQNIPEELSSVGSAVLFKSSIFMDGIRFRGPYEEGLLVGICKDARALGYRVWIDKSVSIIHPTTLWQNQMWDVKLLDIQNLDATCLSQVFSTPNSSFIPGPYDFFILNWLKSIQSKFGVGRYGLIIKKHNTLKYLEIFATQIDTDEVAFGIEKFPSLVCEMVV
jgi:hypothetical protein